MHGKAGSAPHCDIGVQLIEQESLFQADTPCAIHIML